METTTTARSIARVRKLQAAQCAAKFALARDSATRGQRSLFLIDSQLAVDAFLADLNLTLRLHALYA